MPGSASRRRSRTRSAHAPACWPKPAAMRSRRAGAMRRWTRHGAARGHDPRRDHGRSRRAAQRAAGPAQRPRAGAAEEQAGTAGRAKPMTHANRLKSAGRGARRPQQRGHRDPDRGAVARAARGDLHDDRAGAGGAGLVVHRAGRRDRDGARRAAARLGAAGASTRRSTASWSTSTSPRASRCPRATCWPGSTPAARSRPPPTRCRHS